MGREIRCVPANWQHPKHIKTLLHRGQYEISEVYRPMHQYTTFEEAVADFEKEVKNWMKGYQKWQQGIYWNDYNGEETPKAEKLKEWKDGILETRKERFYTDDYAAEELRKYETGVCSWADVAGEPPQYPNPDDYMPSGEWYQLFEDVSEGTPLSPPFATTEELVDWLSTHEDFWGHTWNREAVESLLKWGSAPSAIVQDGKMYKPENQYLLDAA